MMFIGCAVVLLIRFWNHVVGCVNCCVINKVVELCL